MAATDPVAAVEPARLHDALTASVDAARYWQEPDDEDRVLADPAVALELVPLAEEVARAPASGWWEEPLAAHDQHAVGWPEDGGRIVVPWRTGSRAALRTWTAETTAAEERARRERPTDPRASWSGEWWSVPHVSGLLVSRRLPAGLDLVEDSFGWSSARTWPVRPGPAARVFEVTGPAAWTDLVERHPLDVTASRRHVWWRTTGRDGAWALPDWAAVGEEFDAVHLTVDGYLAAAGRALPVRTASGPAGTVLAGWDPGSTWWLVDPPPELEQPTDWVRAGEGPGGWTRRSVG